MVTPARLLVVDDYEANLSGLRAFLQTDYDVVTTTSGSEAIRMAKDAPPDAVLLDVVMPDISGLDVCAELKQGAATRLIPIVLMSGQRRSPDAHRRTGGRRRRFPRQADRHRGVQRANSIAGARQAYDR